MPIFLYLRALDFSMPKERSCGTIVYRKDRDGTVKYLLLHYLSRHWEFPKGHVEKNEKEEQTALRELMEETGIADAKLQDGFRHVITYYFKNGEENIHKEVVFFLAFTRTKHIKLSEEHMGFAWVSYEKALKKVKFGNSKELLEKADNFVKKAV